MRRLLIDAQVCTEVLAAMVAMAWADGELQGDERDGLLEAAAALNISKELRARVDTFVEEAPRVAQLSFAGWSERDRAFAFVAAAWMAHVEGGVVDAEQSLLDEIGTALTLDTDRRAALAEIAAGIERRPLGAGWSSRIVDLFKQIADKV